MFRTSTKFLVLQKKDNSFFIRSASMFFNVSLKSPYSEEFFLSNITFQEEKILDVKSVKDSISAICIEDNRNLCVDYFVYISPSYLSYSIICFTIAASVGIWKLSV